MNDLIARLLDIETLQFGSEGVRLGFERSMPAWAWAGAIVAIGAYSFWSYMRLQGAAGARVGLAFTRWTTLTLLLVLIAGPRLVERVERIESDWVLVLLDRSQSMSVSDASDASGPTGPRKTRDEQMRDSLANSASMWTSLSDDRKVVWLGFDSGAFDLQPDEGAVVPSPGAPEGRRTSLAASLEQALRRAAARPLASVVIFSDGRSIDEPDRATMRRILSERIPIHVVPLGSEDPLGDFAIRSVDAPRSAFLDDLTPVAVRVDRVGDPSAGGATIRLIDADTGLTLDEQPLSSASFDETGAATVTLLHRATDAGRVSMRVELVQREPDLIPGNDATQIAMEFVDRPMRALYIDGYPRWEQRYLKNLLLRERSVVSSNLLLAPDRTYLQEGDVELTRLPTSPEEWAEYDVVILGDVRPEVFSPVQLDNLREHIATRGAGLLWVGGPGATPHAWRGSALADLIPFAISGQHTAGQASSAIVTPTPAAERQGVLRLGETVQRAWPESLSDPAAGWSTIRWWQHVDPLTLKPASETLAQATPVGGGLEGASPLVVSMRFGAGRSIYVATDEIWRWRYGRGELLPERFWLQLIRLLGRESLASSGALATLTVSPRRATVGQAVRISVDLLDQALLEADLQNINVRASRAATNDLSQPDVGFDLLLRRDPADPSSYSATWLPDRAGEWTIRTEESLLASVDLRETIVVSAPDDELRRPESDHALLRRLAAQSNGAVLSPDRVDALENLVPNRERRIIQERTEPLWDAPLALIVVVSLLTIEWVVRRLIRLV